jgi:hypothetical protein
VLKRGYTCNGHAFAVLKRGYTRNGHAFAVLKRGYTCWVVIGQKSEMRPLYIAISGNARKPRRIFGHKEAQKIESWSCTLRRAYRRAKVLGRSSNALFAHFCGQSDRSPLVAAPPR